MLWGKLLGHSRGFIYSGDKPESVGSRVFILSICTLNMHG